MPLDPSFLWEPARRHLPKITTFSTPILHMASCLLWISFMIFVTRNLLPIAATAFENQNSYYPPSDPSVSTPPAGPGGGSSLRSRKSSSPPPPKSSGCVRTPSTWPSLSPPPAVVPPSVVATPPVVKTPPVVVTTPVVLPPPASIFSIPGAPMFLPPYPFDPNTPPFPCNYWKNHPTIIWGLLGWWGTLGSVFDTRNLPWFSSLPGGSLPGLRASDSLMQALSNTRNDGYGELYRQAVAAYLNSLAYPSRFPFTTQQVRDSFVGALSSDKAAAAQGRVFKLANENRLHYRRRQLDAAVN